MSGDKIIRGLEQAIAGDIVRVRNMRTVTFDDDEWQLVPKKPTPGMLAKALSCTSAFLNLTGSKATVNFKKMSMRYRAMLSAAPCPYEKPSNFDLEHECALAERTVKTLLAHQNECGGN